MEHARKASSEHLPMHVELQPQGPTWFLCFIIFLHPNVEPDIFFSDEDSLRVSCEFPLCARVLLSTKQVSNIQDWSYQSLQLIPLWILVSILPVCPGPRAVRRNWWWHEFDGGLEARQVVDSEGKQESLATRVVTVEKPKISTGDFWMHLEHVYVENISWLGTQ